MTTTNDTGRLASALRGALQSELMIGRRLREAADSLTGAITARNSDRICGAETQIGALRSRLDSMEQERICATLLLAARLGIGAVEGRAPTILEIANRLPAPESQRLLSLRSAILATDRLVREANERNRRLLESGLAFVRFSIDALTAVALRQPRYGANPVAAARPSFYIDQRA